MNILPKKRWHVRTKDNIARVRRDEAKAAEEEKIKQDRIKLAEREARTDLLRNRAHQRLVNTEGFIELGESSTPQEPTSSSSHVNLFQDVENQTAEQKQKNKEREKEKKEEQEAYEKKIGYLQYLGQDTNEALGKKNWYDVAPNRGNNKDEKDSIEVNLKSKSLYDPLNTINKLLGIKKDDKKPLKKDVEIATIDSKPINNKYKHKLPESDDNICTKTKKCKKKHKKVKKHKSKKDKKAKCVSESNTSEESEDDEEVAKKRKLELLRAERLRREAEERKKAELLIAKLRGDKITDSTPKVDIGPKQKYNSQFNPDLAKQNYSPPKSKYK